MPTEPKTEIQDGQFIRRRCWYYYYVGLSNDRRPRFKEFPAVSCVPCRKHVDLNISEANLASSHQSFPLSSATQMIPKCAASSP